MTQQDAQKVIQALAQMLSENMGNKITFALANGIMQFVDGEVQKLIPKGDE